VTSGSISDVDIQRIQRWCDRNSPADVADQLRVVAYVDGRNVTLAEERPPWQGDSGEQWESYPFARLTYVKSRDAWDLWVAGGDMVRRYDPLPTGSLTSLLNEIDSDPTFIFRG